MSKSFGSIFYAIYRRNAATDRSLFIYKIDFEGMRVLFVIFRKEF